MFGLFKKKDEPVQEDVKEPVEAAEEPKEEPAAETSPANSEPERDVFVPPSTMHGMSSGIPGFDYSPVDPNEEFKATGGTPLEAGSDVASEDAVIEALRTVYDPEIPVNIYELGLIYSCDIADNGDVTIEMSLTAPGCPVAGEMPGMVVNAVETVEGTGEIVVTLVWEPQWTPERMSDDAKLALGMG